MSIQYFYNFVLKEFDKTDLDGDLLSGVRKSFFQKHIRIKDKITGSSDDEPLFYTFSIEKEKPMKWQVKTADGKTVQETMLSDGGKYYIYYYVNQALFKRLLFSKHHTLLKAEYFDAISGVVRHTLEPRKAQNSLCILYSSKSSAQPTPLFEEPDVNDKQVRRRLHEDFKNYTVVASTDEGIVRFLSEEQIAAFNSLKEKYFAEAAENAEESFVDGETPLLDKIKANDFNVKRNLSTALDITMAMEFGAHDPSEESPAEYAPQTAVRQPEVTQPEVVQPEVSLPEVIQPVEPVVAPDIPDDDETILIDGYVPLENTVDEAHTPSVNEDIIPQSTPEPVEPEPETVEVTETAEQIAVPSHAPTDVPVAEPITAPVPTPITSPTPAPVPVPAAPEPVEQPVEKTVFEPDKRIMADGEIYSYYGELDANGNRSGYGRTMTELGRTAYEGSYYNDKRSGNGSYFYRDGSLCYTGDWMENVRHGVGVGVSSRDGSIHVGNWKNNKPDGNGVRLTSDGDIKFVCKELFDGTTVLMHYMPDDSVIISKYDKFGMKIGDKTLSLKDLPF